MTALLDRPLSTVLRINSVSHVLHGTNLRPHHAELALRLKGRINNTRFYPPRSRLISASHLISQPIENNFHFSKIISSLLFPSNFSSPPPVASILEGKNVNENQIHLFYRKPSARRTDESSNKNFAISDRTNSTRSLTPPIFLPP